MRLMYRFALGRWPNLKNPRRYTEKLQWLKLHDHNPRYTALVDKLAVKKYIAEKFGPEYVFKVWGQWDRAEDVDFSVLPQQFVLKCNHLGGGLVTIVKDKTKINLNRIRKKLRWQLKHSMYWGWREWPYKSIPPMIFAEEYRKDEFGELRDYKVFCFHGEPKFMLVASNRFSSHNMDALYMDGTHCSFNSSDGLRNPDLVLDRKVLDELTRLAKILSADFLHVRVDFYVIEGKVYFGELTFCDSSGLDNYGSDEADLRIGEWLDLKNVIPSI